MKRLRWGRAALGLAAGVAVALGVALLIGNAAGYARLLDSLELADARWLPLCAAAVAVEYAAYALVFREIVRFEGGPRLPFGLSLHISLAALGAIRVVAVAGAGALALVWWALRRAGFSRDEAVVRVLALNTLVFGVFGVGAWIAALFAVAGEPGLALPWLGVVGFCVAAALWVTAARRRDRLSRLDGGRVRRAFAYAVGGTALVRRLFPRGVAAAALYWAGDVVCLWAALRAFGVRLGLAEVVLAYATGYAATILPLPFAGVGGVDAAMTFAVHAVGIPLAPALLGVFAYRLFSFWLPTAPALAALALVPRATLRLQPASSSARTPDASF